MRRLVVALIASALLLASCGIPHRRSTDDIRKPAATDAEIERIFERYRTVRNAAIDLLDPKPLSIVERGAVLDIDSGSFRVAQAQSVTRDGIGPIDVETVVKPTFTEYPLWFYAVVRDTETRVLRIQIFERETPTEPWLLVVSPEAALGAKLPELRSSSSTGAMLVKLSNSKGMSMSPQDAADTYARAIPAAGTKDAKAIVEDAFMKQMRETASQNATLKGVRFSQTWTVQPIKYALRTKDGGALVFADLERTDTYIVQGNRQVTFPQGTPQAALLMGGIQRRGALKYLHEVLIYVPPSGKPKAIGQYGGVVSVSGS